MITKLRNIEIKFLTYTQLFNMFNFRNVKINVEGAESSYLTSTADGKFILKGVSKAPLVLKAMLDGYDFDRVTIDKVEPNMKLPPLQPTRFK